LQTNSNTIAQTILEQLEARKGCMMMLGARNIVGSKDGLTFAIGKNAKRVTHIRIVLDADTYTIEALRVWKSKGAPKCDTIDISSGVYVDRMHATIERMTGMYTSLGTMGAK
jgi:hypothetical protein